MQKTGKREKRQPGGDGTTVINAAGEYTTAFSSPFDFAPLRANDRYLPDVNSVRAEPIEA